MAFCGLAAMLAVAVALVRLGARGRRLYGAVCLFALSPLAVGPISLNTYDLWPAALTAGALAALLGRRELLACGLLGLAVTAKLYPLVLLPPVVVYVWLTAGRRRALTALGVLAAVAAAVVLPFAVLAPDGLWDSFHAQSARGLQIESLGASVLLAAHRLGLYDATVVHGSTEAAAVAAFLVFNRFISPQYLVWLIPLVLLVPGSAGLEAAGLLAGSLALGQIWFFHYRDVFALEGGVWPLVPPGP